MLAPKSGQLQEADSEAATCRSHQGDPAGPDDSTSDYPDNFDDVEKQSLWEKVKKNYDQFKESRTNLCVTMLSLSTTLKPVGLSFITDSIALALSFTVYVDIAMTFLEQIAECG